MDGVGCVNDKFTFLINSRLSEPLFITAESTTALCLGSWMSELGLFGDVVVVCLINPEGGSVVKIGNVPPCLPPADSSWSEVTCCCAGMGSSSGCFTDILSSRSSLDLSLVFMTCLSLWPDLSSLVIISGFLNLIN